jgi:hypothetical protein
LSWLSGTASRPPGRLRAALGANEPPPSPLPQCELGAPVAGGSDFAGRGAELASGMSTFALSEEHQALREAVRALADDKIAPRAAEVDAKAEFPWEPPRGRIR